MARGAGDAKMSINAYRLSILSPQATRLPANGKDYGDVDRGFGERRKEDRATGSGSARCRSRRRRSCLYYIDETIGQGIVKLMPDGTIHLIDPDQDEDVVLRTIMPGR
jgi:hypothetical protein